jgi:hypothetical protein
MMVKGIYLGFLHLSKMRRISKSGSKAAMHKYRTLTNDALGNGAWNPGLFSLMTLKPKASTFVSAMEGNGDAAAELDMTCVRVV